MNEEKVRVALAEALSEIAPEAEVSNLDWDVELRDQVELDSMDLLNFLVGVQARTGVEIPESAYGELSTLRDLLGHVMAIALSK